MSLIDMSFSIIAIGTCIFSAIWTSRHWVKKIKKDSRSFDDCIEDIRAMNNYNSYFLAAILIFLGFTIDKGIDVLPKTSLIIIMVLAAFVFAAFAIIFIPLEKTKSGGDTTNVKILWLYTLIPSQWVVILCVSGIVNAVLPKIL